MDPIQQEIQAKLASEIGLMMLNQVSVSVMLRNAQAEAASLREQLAALQKEPSQ